MKYYVGIDLGGTNIVAGVVDGDYNIIAKARQTVRVLKRKLQRIWRKWLYRL